MKFLIDAMLPSHITEELSLLGHDAISLWTLGSPTLRDPALIDIASAAGRVIVTENIKDFADVTRCSVLLVRKNWWPNDGLVQRIATSLDRWSEANPEPGPWAQWLEVKFR